MRASPFLLVVMFACKHDDASIEKDTPKPSKPKVTKSITKAPEKHRKEHATCSKVDTPAPKTSTFKKMPDEPGPPCTTRADCKGTDMRCLVGHCVHDECTKDTDCGKGVCECVDTPYRGRGHFCHAGNCAVDADCGESFCSPTFGFSCGSYSGVVGYYCHTRDDLCLNDADCRDGSSAYGYCAYDQEKKYWRCGYAECDG